MSGPKEGIEKILNSKSKTFLAFCFCFIAGTASFSFTENPKVAYHLYISIFAVLFLILIFWRGARGRLFLFCALFFLLGAWRFCLAIPENIPEHINYYNGASMEITGYVSDEPDVGLDGAKYLIKVESCMDGGIMCPRNMSGKVVMPQPLYPRYGYGEELKIKCVLQSPKNYPESAFNYKNYLAERGVWSVCSSPKIIAVSGGDRGSPVIKNILAFKQAVAGQIGRLWPEPDASFVSGLLYGSKSTLPKDISDNFTRTGVTHIIAVSGFNVSIIVGFLMTILMHAGLYRKQAFWVVLPAIILFVFFSGATGSVVRASVMGIVVLTGQYLGRPSRIGNALIFTVVAMVLFNPYILIWDAGFQLSFLSTAGLIYLSAPVSGYLCKIKVPELVLENLSTTLAAIIATMPLILYQFGRLSVAAPVVNVLILWIIPWLMLFSFASLVVSFAIFPLGQIAAWLSAIGLNYVIMTVDWFGGASWSAVDFQIPTWLMLALYALIILAYVKKNKSSEARRGI